MAISRHSILAREGQTVVLLSAVLAFVLHLQYGNWALLLWLLTACLAWLYRDPSRFIPSSPLTVVSPVDGRVIRVETAADRFLKRQALHVELQMSLLGVYSLRSVTEGKVQQIWQENNAQGKCLAIWIQTDEQDDTVLVIRPGRWLKRLSYQLGHGDRIGHGQRIGHILFGSRIDVYLPAGSRSKIEAGQILRAGSDAIAEFIHP
jgi:phosphatidylserine decarboxylase